jgi:predicted nucleotidyltransferase
MSKEQFGLSKERFNFIYNVFKNFPNIEKVIIFGSRALGTYKTNSDIDLAIVGKNININDIINIKIQLEELPLGYSFDIIDYKEIDNQELKKHIDDNGQLFY